MTDPEPTLVGAGYWKRVDELVDRTRATLPPEEPMDDPSELLAEAQAERAAIQSVEREEAAWHRLRGGDKRRQESER